VWYKFTDVSEQRIASIFRVEQKAKQATSKMRSFLTGCFSLSYSFLIVASFFCFASCLLERLLNPEDGSSTFTETSVNLYLTTWRPNPYDSSLNSSDFRLKNGGKRVVILLGEYICIRDDKFYISNERFVSAIIDLCQQ
jgi:hypothetical protein